MRKYLVLILCLCSNFVSASFPLEVSDKALIEKTDHVLIARVIGVDMIDGDGKQIYDLQAKTGPKSENQIRLIFAVDQVLETNSKSVPEKLFVPLDSFMHFTFGQIKEHYPEVSEQRLLLLSGKDFHPPVAGHFQRNLQDKEHYLELFKTNKLSQRDK